MFVAQAAQRDAALGLIMAMLAGVCRNSAYAAGALAEAERLCVDPIDYCARRFGLTETLVLQRAAHWAGFGFSDTVPTPPGKLAADRLDHLGDTRTLRGMIGGRDVTFYAPRFADLLNLAAARATRPDLARRICIVPGRALRARLSAMSTRELLVEARTRMTRTWPHASAEQHTTRAARIVFVAIFAVVGLAVTVAPYFFSLALLPLVATLILLPAIIRVAALLPHRHSAHVPTLGDAQLPVYTVLIPLRDEASMVPQLQRAMLGMDYPPDKLQVIFAVERKSTETVAAVRAILGDARFEMVLIPDAAPHTKPKALNFALPMVRGEHVVVFDAEDIPQRNQLRLAASRFAADPDLHCAQAELSVDNPEENWLTALFGAEYAGQFGLTLPLLGRWGLPMPLGGTSNHFRTTTLRALGHWDAFNVTEDADLGVRLARRRLKTDTLASTTGEEAAITMRAWMAQRTRWIKGWMQTFIVHNRQMGTFIADLGWRNFLFFQIYVGGLIVSSLLHTAFVFGITIRGIFGHWPRIEDPVDVAYVSILAIGYGSTAALFLAGLIRKRAWHLLPYQLFQPIYWMLHSLAAIRAAIQLIRDPFYWGKTEHGQTRKARSFGG